MGKDINAWKKIFPDKTGQKQYRLNIEKQDAAIGAFLEFDPDKGRAISSSEGSLSGVPFAVKDNIAVERFRLTCGSKMLENFVSPYTATAVSRLLKSGAVVVGKTNLDEFGMGSSCDNSALKKTGNPWDITRVAGGSSGGSAAAVAAGFVPFALGSDTGGSVRQPASFCGVYGLKPTYGSVSRYGLVAYASSLEVIGIISADVATAREVFTIIRGIDPMDQTSMMYPDRVPDKAEGRIGILAGDLGLEPEVEKSYKACIDTFKNLGYEIVTIHLPLLEYVVPAYYTIATAEASSNLARFNGIKYGLRPEYAENPEELVRKARNVGFGEEVKLRILLGTFVLRSGFQDQYYLRAQKIRTAIRMEFDNRFNDVDMILMPVFPTRAFAHGKNGLDAFQQKIADRFTCTANLAGIPAFSFPSSVEAGLPVGMQLLGPAFSEDLLFQTVSRFEKIFPAPVPPAFSGEGS